ncbi:MAG TPA: hypothetical protein VM096_18720 [Vicinamibacterales bacterium]|nr:hypothetical protein [Vicinamibacterales bacterium]
MKRTWAALIIGLALIATAHAQRSRYEVMDDSTVTRTLNFAAGGGRSLDVRNTNGFIHVEGTNDASVQMSIHKVIRAETRDDLAEAQRDVRLDFKEAVPRVEAVVTDRGGHVCGEQWNNRGNEWEHVHYDVKFDFTIRVPRNAALRLCTINGGDVIVNGTQGDFDVSNVNGLIEMNKVAGSGRAHTVNGPVTVSFTANPKQPSSFKTVNGNVDVSFLEGLSAEFAMKTFNGGLFTDFDAQPLPNPVSAAGERRNGKFVYRANEFTRVRVGSGGPQIDFETLNGNVRARRAGGR